MDFNATTNATLPPPAADLLPLRQTWVIAITCVLLSIVIIVTILGNSAVIYTISADRNLRDQVSSAYLVNLSVTDMSSAVFVMLPALVFIGGDMRDVNRHLCRLTCGANYCCIIVSMLTLAIISVDRLLAVKYSLHYRRWVSARTVLPVIALTWLQGALFGLAPIIMDWVRFDYWEATCAIEWHKEGRGPIDYVIVAFVVCFGLPAVTMVVCYTITVRQAKRCLGNTPNADGKVLKTVVSLLVVVAIFFLCMTPFSVTKLLKVIIKDQTFVPPYVNLTAAFFGYFSSMVNPFIYGIFRPDFRAAYRKMLRMHASEVSVLREVSKIQESAKHVPQSQDEA